ncbi:hypothetical protein Cgig2_030625 [Carnegiea gigantea]|uniref:26S proteasome non-ATPase regulatory subunit 5 n=1 Tax=Carnegiea gigantea TaxID=171969 RepID=A0A9Q1K7E3_9CARY|nr:hypothetical protein Cgig2_030625 [Carnegiea gigantea]
MFQGRVRVLALIVKLFSVSQSVASAICSSNLLDLMEAGVSKTDDTLATLSTLELLFEMAEVEHATEFLPKTHLLQLLNSIISNTCVESILRSRAMMISGRVLSRESIFTYIDEPSVLEIISAIERTFASCEVIDDNECESALEAIGQLATHGAELLLLKSPDAARFLVNAAFDRQRRGKQLAALHALGNIARENRSQNNILLKREAEESLRHLIYETASGTSKLTPSGLLLSVLQQESEIRLAWHKLTIMLKMGNYYRELVAVQTLQSSRTFEVLELMSTPLQRDLPISLFQGYRLMSGLVARPWCLVEVCSKQEIINIVTDAYIESTKIGMEARHNCCLAIHQALARSSNLKNDSALAAISAKVHEAVKRGPYLAQKHREARPAIMTEQRF